MIVTNRQEIGDLPVGGKAKNLAKLKSLGIPVPDWLVVIPEEVDDHALSIENGPFCKSMQEIFGIDFREKKFAVRSSAIDEDGGEYSFAGQFESFLNVHTTDILNKLTQVKKSVFAPRVLEYRKKHGLGVQHTIGIIIQEMVNSEISGVAFGIDPRTGKQGSKVIAAVYGLGEGLVSGELNADNYYVDGSSIQRELVDKEEQFVYDMNGGLVKVKTPEKARNKSALSDDQIDQLIEVLNRLEQYFKHPQDIEFAFSEGNLFLLQTRPITAIPTEKKGEYTVWDNSNIVESYPGITTPLTFTFILKMYEQVYRQFVGLLGLSDQEINLHRGVFAQTLGLVRGRVYYNLLNWYKMLAMLPGYSINAGFMENMMGVKEQFELKDEFIMTKGKARWRIFLMVFNMLYLQSTLKGNRRRFKRHLNKTLNQYLSYDFSTKTDFEIIDLYKNFEQGLLLKWKAPLINDFFAMIWFGLLQKFTAKHFPDDPNIHNDLLCGSQDIISVEPIHRSLEISSYILDNEEIRNFFEKKTPSEIWTQLLQGKFPELYQLFHHYLADFGERCVGELKLETRSYSQEPEKFVHIIKSYVKQEVRIKKGNHIDLDLRKNAEIKLKSTLSGKIISSWWLKIVLNKARNLVSNRENLRYERTRGFGMVRKMMTSLGDYWTKQGIIEKTSDVFYLELSEIISFNSSSAAGFKELISNRKLEFEQFGIQKVPIERFFTYGNDFSDQFIYSTEKLTAIEGDLKGIGCCPGIVKKRIQVIHSPDEIESLNGDILVTSSTDPGWVTLFPTVGGIIVERGSLLSHSAIVSREMGIPCIVGVTGLLRTLNTGDEIIMDGSTGIIKKVTA